MTSDENSPPPFEPPQPTDPVPQSIEPTPPTEPSPASSTFEMQQTVSSPARVIPEDLRTPWDWIDLVIFALLALGAAFAISVLMVVVFSAFGIGPGRLRSSATLRSYYAITNQIVVSLALFGYLATQTRLRVRLPFWRTIGWRPLESGEISKSMTYLGLIVGGFLLSMFVQFASGISRPKTRLPIEAFFQDRRSALLLMIVSVALAPLVEETIFRGYIYPVIARSFGIATSVVVTGTLFGLLHAPQLWGGWTQIALLIGVGIIFTWARAATRTVFASYLLHVSYNSFLFIAFLVGSHWLRSIPPVH